MKVNSRLSDMKKSKTKKPAPSPKYTAAQVNAIAGQSKCAPNTVKRWASGLHCYGASIGRITDACAALGIPTEWVK